MALLRLTLAPSWRGMNRFGYGPAKLQAAPDQILAQVVCSLVSVGRHLSVRCLYDKDRAFVSGLFKASGPSAILRAIGAIVVDTVNAVCVGRSRSHVVKERREVIQPSVANDNASASVMPIGFLSSSVAAGLNRAPRFILSRIAHAMPKELSAGLVALQASAAMRIVASQIATTNTGCVPAIAAAFPIDFIWICSWQFPNNKQPSESSAGIFDALHG